MSCNSDVLGNKNLLEYLPYAGHQGKHVNETKEKLVVSIDKEYEEWIPKHTEKTVLNHHKALSVLKALWVWQKSQSSEVRSVAGQSLGDMLGEDLPIGWSVLACGSGVDTDVLEASFTEQVNIKLHVCPLPPATSVHIPLFSLPVIRFLTDICGAK